MAPVCEEEPEELPEPVSPERVGTAVVMTVVTTWPFVVVLLMEKLGIG